MRNFQNLVSSLHHNMLQWRLAMFQVLKIHMELVDAMLESVLLRDPSEDPRFLTVLFL